MESRRLWEIIGRRVRFSARPYVVVTQEHVRTSFNVEVSDFYRVELAPFSVCVPQLSDGRIVTLWQYKHGPKQYGLSFPAGFLNSGEDPLDGCIRELWEETGYVSNNWRHLGQYVDSGNQQGSVGNYYFASGCEVAGLPLSGDLEDMEVRLMTVPEVDAALEDGNIHIIHHVAAWGLVRRFLIERASHV